MVPATLALLLARQASRQAYAAEGYLTGAAWLRRGRRLAWAGLVLALTSLVIASIAGLLHRPVRRPARTSPPAPTDPRGYLARVAGLRLSSFG